MANGNNVIHNLEITFLICFRRQLVFRCWTGEEGEEEDEEEEEAEEEEFTRSIPSSKLKLFIPSNSSHWTKSSSASIVQSFE